MLFQNKDIRVKDLRLIWRDQTMHRLNNEKVILVFGNAYSKAEYDEIYDWFKNVIKCNHLSELDTFEWLGQNGVCPEPYDDHHDSICNKICYIENCDLNLIKKAHDLFDMYQDGYQSYYICADVELEGAIND